MSVRKAAVAGTFYPGSEPRLRNEVRKYLADTDRAPGTPKAMILPHAGYVYSGPVAASGYALLEGCDIQRVVLLGPAHFHPLRGLATHSADSFETPLGAVPVDIAARDRIEALSAVERVDAAHESEHSLEVHLPFLQTTLGEFKVLPVLVGETSPEIVADALDAVWGGNETLIVVSSDLSHFHDYRTARRRDRKTAELIEALDAGHVGPYDACGCRAINGLLAIALRKKLRVTTLDLRNSGDTAGPRDEVVGYGAFLFENADATTNATRST
jgi:AmmeMemoRadiSam system protein B